MSCPDRMQLFAWLEEGCDALEAHLSGCPSCRAAVEEELSLDRSLQNLRDPAPPADLISGAWARIDEAAAIHAKQRRQVLTGLSAGLAFIGTVVAVFWHELVVRAAVDLAHSLSGAVTAAGALYAAAEPHLAPLSPAIYTAQAATLTLAAVLFFRLLNASPARS